MTLLAAVILACAPDLCGTRQERDAIAPRANLPPPSVSAVPEGEVDVDLAVRHVDLRDAIEVDH